MQKFRGMFIVLLMCALSACTLPRFQPALPATQPAHFTPNSVVMNDATTLPLRQWLPRQATPKAVIIALHGFNDYSNSFTYPARYFAENGIAVFAYDQRGFGATNHAGIWGGKENLTQDLAQMVRLTKQRYPHTPLYLLGESMGGAVTVAAVTNPHFPTEKVQGVILSAPALWGGNTLNPLHRFVLWIAAHNLPQMTLTGKGIKILASDNIAMLKALGRDPLVIKKTRVDAIYGLVQLMDEAQDKLHRVPLPMLLLYGTHDQVIPPKAIAAAIDDMPSGNRMALYDTGWHMLLRDLRAKRVWQDVVAWTEHPTQPLPSQTELKPADFWQTYRKLKDTRHEK